MSTADEEREEILSELKALDGGRDVTKEASPNAGEDPADLSTDELCQRLGTLQKKAENGQLPAGDGTGTPNEENVPSGESAAHDGEHDGVPSGESAKNEGEEPGVPPGDKDVEESAGDSMNNKEDGGNSDGEGTNQMQDPKSQGKQAADSSGSGDTSDEGDEEDSEEGSEDDSEEDSEEELPEELRENAEEAEEQAEKEAGDEEMSEETEEMLNEQDEEESSGEVPPQLRDYVEEDGGEEKESMNQSMGQEEMASGGNDSFSDATSGMDDVATHSMSKAAQAIETDIIEDAAEEARTTKAAEELSKRAADLQDSGGDPLPDLDPAEADEGNRFLA